MRAGLLCWCLMAFCLVSPVEGQATFTHEHVGAPQSLELNRAAQANGKSSILVQSPYGVKGDCLNCEQPVGVQEQAALQSQDVELVLPPNVDRDSYVDESPSSGTPTATRNPAACKINNENWCGSGSLAGYWTNGEGVAGALVATNAHVATTRIGDRMEMIFNMGEGRARAFVGTNLIAAYSNARSVDWAIVFVPGLTKESGIEPLKLSKDNPDGTTFQFTGSPRCVWPQTSVDVRLVQSTARGVVMWQPPTIGGQSGSILRKLLDNGTFRGEILLTWRWGGNGAGQPTSLIWENMQTGSNDGPPRPPGLIEVATQQAHERGIESGFFASPELLTTPPGLEFAAARVVTVQELPIWWTADGGVEPPPAGDFVTRAEFFQFLLDLQKGNDAQGEMIESWLDRMDD